MKIVCIGDSFINGFGVGKNTCWVTQLNNMMDAEVVNKGINGDTTGGILARFYQDVVAEKPKYAIIDGGWNDFLAGAEIGNVQANVMSVIHQSYNHGIIPIFVLVPMGNLSTFKQNWPSFIDIEEILDKYKRYHDWVIEFCKGFSVFHIDCSSYTDNDDFRYSHYLDGIHMDQAGHDIIAKYVYDNLQTILGL